MQLKLNGKNTTVEAKSLQVDIHQVNGITNQKD